MTNVYLSNGACSGFSPQTLFVQPFEESKKNLIYAVMGNDCLANRVKHGVAAMLLACPVANSISLLALRKIGRIEISQDKGCGVFTDKAKDSEWDTILHLTKRGRFMEAWECYCQYESIGNRPRRIITEYTRIPPEELIFGVARHLIADERAISEWIHPIELVRDCAIAYPRFAAFCLEQPLIWIAFRGYTDCIVDVAKSNTNFAFSLLTSSRGDAVEKDARCLEVLKGAYPSIVSAIEQNKISVDEMRHLVLFLMSYRSVVKEEDFEKVKGILSALQKCDEKWEERDQCCHLIELAIGKFYTQGIFGFERMGVSYNVEIDEIFKEALFDAEWIESAARLVAAANGDKDVQRGMFYLSLTPKNSPHYVDSRLALGNLWLDSEQPEEARKYFREAAELGSPDAVTLLAVSTFVKVQEGRDWKFVPKDTIDKSTPHKTLSPMDISDWTLETIDARLTGTANLNSI